MLLTLRWSLFIVLAIQNFEDTSLLGLIEALQVRVTINENEGVCALTMTMGPFAPYMSRSSSLLQCDIILTISGKSLFIKLNLSTLLLLSITNFYNFL